MTIYVVGVWYVTSYSSHCTLTDVRAPPAEIKEFISHSDHFPVTGSRWRIFILWVSCDWV